MAERHVYDGPHPQRPKKQKRAPAGNPWRGQVLRQEQERHARQLAAKEAAERAAIVKPLSRHMRQAALAEWKRREEVDGWNAATRWLNAYAGPLMKRVHALRTERESNRVVARDVLNEWSSDASVKSWAKRRAAESQLHIERAGADWLDRYAAAREFVSRWGIEPVTLPESLTPADFAERAPPAVRRMACPQWWKRKARRWLDQSIEADKLEAGKVRRGVSIYVSERNVQRGRDQFRRNQQLLMDLIATNELGQSFSIADLQERSTANPHVRLSELMVRLRGCEALADRMGYIGLFLTWTLPSRFHRWLSRENTSNPKWEAGGRPQPRDGQAQLVKWWANVRANLAKLHARYFGIRVAEPHHDGCPHWHLLLFVAPDHRAAVLDIIRRWALVESPDEDGAQEHRFKVEEIDKSKGGATSYVAKYVSKMTTGAGLGEAEERCADGERRTSGKPSEAARRARRWASIHRIRQFQFVGLPPIGIWRECRRLEETPDEVRPGIPLSGMQRAVLERARFAAEENDYMQHVLAIGGAAVPRAKQKLMVWREQDGSCTDYGDLRPATARGVCFRLAFTVPVKKWRTRRGRRRKDGRQVIRSRQVLVQQPVRLEGGQTVTREHTWTVGLRGAAAAVAFVVPQAPSDQETRGGDATPWTRITNCNHPPDAEEKARQARQANRSAERLEFFAGADARAVELRRRVVQRLVPGATPEWVAQVMQRNAAAYAARAVDIASPSPAVKYSDQPPPQTPIGDRHAPE